MRQTSEFGVRHSFAVAGLKNPTSVFPPPTGTTIVPAALNLSSKVRGAILEAYQAGSPAGVMVPQISPGVEVEILVAR